MSIWAEPTQCETCGWGQRGGKEHDYSLRTNLLKSTGWFHRNSFVFETNTLMFLKLNQWLKGQYLFYTFLLPYFKYTLSEEKRTRHLLPCQKKTSFVHWHLGSTQMSEERNWLLGKEGEHLKHWCISGLDFKPFSTKPSRAIETQVSEGIDVKVGSLCASVQSQGLWVGPLFSSSVSVGPWVGVED